MHFASPPDEKCGLGGEKCGLGGEKCGLN